EPDPFPKVRRNAVGTRPTRRWLILVSGRGGKPRPLPCRCILLNNTFGEASEGRYQHVAPRRTNDGAPPIDIIICTHELLCRLFVFLAGGTYPGGFRAFSNLPDRAAFCEVRPDIRQCGLGRHNSRLGIPHQPGPWA